MSNEDIKHQTVKRDIKQMTASTEKWEKKNTKTK